MHLYCVHVPSLENHLRSLFKCQFRKLGPKYLQKFAYVNLNTFYWLKIKCDENEFKKDWKTGTANVYPLLKY